MKKAYMVLNSTDVSDLLRCVMNAPERSKAERKRHLKLHARLLKIEHEMKIAARYAELTMARLYKAGADNDLFALLYSLNSHSICPQYIETDGSLLVKVSCCYNVDIVADCYINENGIIFNGHKDVMSKLTIGTDTLIQLAAMSTCFAAGYAKARQEHAEKQLQQEQENNQ